LESQLITEEQFTLKRSPQLDRYKRFVEEDLLSQIYDAAESLAGLHVLHVNTTAQGGGVAELLHVLIPLMQELGIKHTWKVIPLDEASNLFAAHLVDLLQGIEHGAISEEDQRVFLAKLRRTPVMSRAEENQADIYFVHDFQLAPLATLFPWMRPAIWMCHVDTANPDPQGKAYIDQFLDAYKVCVFNTPLSVFKDLPPEKTHVITPTIDPFSEKNRFLTPAKGLQMLARCGIDTTRPLITQVSRFGNWKNPWQVIDVYRLVKQELPAVQVALVGAMEAADDIKAIEILKDVQAKAGGDPDIHLLYDPAMIKHPEVNAFQRYSSVILQRSIREGFGLTVTEAMWKYQPVVGTSVTGLRTQISDGRNGYIADDTETCAERTLKLIQDRDLWRKLGKAAHARVRKNYLLPVMVLQYLGALKKALGMYPAAGQPQAVLDRASSSRGNPGPSEKPPPVGD
jgi:trehalose synthase